MFSANSLNFYTLAYDGRFFGSIRHFDLAENRVIRKLIMNPKIQYNRSNSIRNICRTSKNLFKILGNKII